MVILFKQEHVDPILRAIGVLQSTPEIHDEPMKIETRRLGPKRWNVGAVHQARTAMLGRPFAWLEIKSHRRDYLSAMTDADAWVEGYRTMEDFKGIWKRINDGEWDPTTLVHIVRFLPLRSANLETWTMADYRDHVKRYAEEKECGMCHTSIKSTLESGLIHARPPAPKSTMGLPMVNDLTGKKMDRQILFVICPECRNETMVSRLMKYNDIINWRFQDEEVVL